MAAKNESNELKVTRLYDAPLSAVWAAWTDVNQLAQWWGPRGFTITTHSKELKPGGTWRYTMHGPDGTDYPNITTYLEVDSQRRLVYDHGATEKTPPLFRVTVTFAETPRGTKMVMTMTAPSFEAAEAARAIVKKASGESTWDRLGEFLIDRTSGKKRFLINRSFDCSRETMFELWSMPEHFAKWLPPTGATMRFIRADIRAGGDGFFAMTNADGSTMYGRVEYKEITPPERLVYEQMFCDVNEKLSRHPTMPLWPERMITTVTLTEEGPDRTRVTVCWEPGPTATQPELDLFVTARAGMTQGWSGSFDKLEALVEARERYTPSHGD